MAVTPPAPALPFMMPPPAQESSTALRAISILASRNPDGDFKVDDSRLIIKYSPQYIAEGTSQEDKHDRYTNMTFFILACISPMIDALRESSPKDKRVDDYDDLVSDLSKCHIVAVASVGKTIGGVKDFSEVTASIGRGDGKDDMDPVPASMIQAPITSFAEGIREARENGFRKINCTARMHYFMALQLSYRIGYMRPDEGMDIRTNAASREDMLKGEEKRKGLI